ncbi:MAG: BON domain-containing protein [Fimbriiglobus sp.]
MATTWLEAPESVSAAAFLRQSPHVELRRLTVIVTPENLILSGSVPTYHLKQMALETIRSSAQGRKIVNRVRVEAL